MDYKNYNWYPGHMKKALDGINDRISRCDAIFMMIDVRSYKSGFNEWLHQSIRAKNKLPIVILSRKDLIPKEYDVNRINQYFDNLGLPHYLINISNGKLESLLNPVRITKKIINNRYPGETDFRPTIMIVGMPNSGKSTYINALKKRASAQAANIPGVTKRVSLFTIKNLATVLDTPGVLIPDRLDEDRAFPLHLIRAIKKDIVPIAHSVCWGLEKIYIHSRERYKELAWKFHFSETVLPTYETIERDIGHISMQRIYSYISEEYPFIWDW